MPVATKKSAPKKPKETSIEAPSIPQPSAPTPVTINIENSSAPRRSERKSKAPELVEVAPEEDDDDSFPLLEEEEGDD
ncbi:MAG: hypothetical protein H0T92_24825 [Pyrinomonadaceae bacterium]|nr:hypothetical protein [Pyrinomonadaceae bacterium]